MKYPLKISMAVAISSIVLALSFVTYINTKNLTRHTAEQTSERLFQSVSNTIKHNIHALVDDAMNTATLLAQGIALPSSSVNNFHQQDLEMFFSILNTHEPYYSVYLGQQNGDFLQLIAVRKHESIRQKHNAPDNTTWILRKIFTQTDGSRIQQWIFLDQDRQVLTHQTDSAPEYDPRKRPWYEQASSTSSAVLSNVYVFNSLQETGLTVSHQSKQNNGIFGIDLRLTKLADIVAQQPISENGFALIFDDSRKSVTLPSFLSAPAMAKLSEISDTRVQGILDVHENGQADNSDTFVSIEEVETKGPKLYISVVAPKTDFMSAFILMKERLFYVIIGGLVIFLPIALIFSQRMSQRVQNLVNKAKRIEDLDFDIRPVRRSRIKEFFQLENSFEAMRGSLMSKTKALAASQEKLDKLVKLGIAMSAEKNSEKVMELLIQGAKELSGAEGGSLYVVDHDELQFKIVFNDPLGLSMGGTQDDPPNLPPVQLMTADGTQNLQNVVTHAYHHETSINIPDAYVNEEFDFSGTRQFDELNDYKSRSFLTVPLKPRGGGVIGCLQVINAKNGSGDIVPFTQEIQEFIEALAAQAATVLYNRNLLDAQQKLMDSLIQLLAGAIDAKSPYTGAHCGRVPELATMMAKEASQRSDGIFKDFRFNTEEEWREFSIGAWLHDCGKVITPEYVVDKATKLETIYNRIHEIRTRFEVLLRDAEIDYYKGLTEGKNADKLKTELETRKKQLIDDFAFVATCNVGGEFMSPEQIERLENIAQQEWVRNFDIHLGLSHEEASLFDNAADAPTTEKLLDDKPYHVIARDQDISDSYQKFGFKTPIPENLYNRGELYNLRVARGTLTEEERFKINEHVMQTIAMLESLPFPAHMERVPEYAGTHHETMIGTGYPRQLSADELSVPSRIMAVADIFEALTASDRPYKKAKSLSEAVKILSFFKKDQHIDSEIFDMFLTSGIYKTYAEQYLKEDQIDDVDITQYVTFPN